MPVYYFEINFSFAETNCLQALKSKIDQYLIDRVREIRIEKDVSQEKLSLALGKDKTYIAKIERGVENRFYNSKALNDIASILDCSPRDFWPNKPLTDNNI